MVERVDRRGGSSVCPRGSVNRMDELRVSLMPPRSSMSPLGATTSSSMLRGDSETECLREEPDDGAFDDDDDRFFPRTKLTAFLMVPCCKNTQTTLPGFLAGRKIAQRKYMEEQELW